MIYILMGGPATGKGTRSDILAKALNIPHIATGDMLREVAKTNEEIAESLKRGELIHDDIITALLEERIMKEDCENGFVLDGYPRTARQTKLLDEMLEKHGKEITKVMELVASDEVVFERILQRKQCDDCGEIYGRDFPPKVEGICDRCGGHLTIRTDDTKETVAKRIKTYKNNSKEILDFYRNKGLLITVDAEGSPSTVTEDIYL